MVVADLVAAALLHLALAAVTAGLVDTTVDALEQAVTTPGLTLTTDTEEVSWFSVVTDMLIRIGTPGEPMLIELMLLAIKMIQSALRCLKMLTSNK